MNNLPSREQWSITSDKEPAYKLNEKANKP